MLPTQQKSTGKFTFESDRTIRNGFSAFNTKFADMIEREADSNEEIKALVDSDVWTGFLEADIKPTKALNEMVLAGQKDSEEEEKS